ncbi:hypothetical protein [Streptomyces catenulae]|uniref:Secreted protein n=1 Tax=Streptomyces catenulae TaxID=66875 RepID=A0ABV2YY18_9ACTN|nr:hypothetical protein [Streptomyces catenulae]
MEAAIAIVGLLFLLFVVAGVFVTVKAVQVTKRGVDRTVAQARRTVEDTGLRARQLAKPGVPGELAQLRLSLRTSMRATQEALREGAAEDGSLSEALGLFDRLSTHGRALDDELRRLEREPDRATTAARLPELRERLERITHSAESLRWAARDRQRKFAEDDLSSLSDQIDVESGALRHWTRASDAADGAADSGSTEAPGRSGAARSSAAPEPEAEQPQAIPAADPRRRSAYSWQKTPSWQKSPGPERAN